MNYYVEGIVLRSLDYGEGNKIVTLYTRELGKVGVMARGAKKLRSRHAAITQPFTRAQFSFFKGNQMGTLNSGELIQSYHDIRSDLLKAAYAAYVVEMVDRMTAEQEPFPGLYDQLGAALDGLEQNKDAQIIIHIWELIMLRLAGYSPQFDACAGCGAETEGLLLHAGLGGTVCPVCAARAGDAMKVTGHTVTILRTLQRMSLKQLGQTNVSSATKAQLREFLQSFMDQHVGIRWKSRSFIEQMERYDLR